jgi:hypothetical protein
VDGDLLLMMTQQELDFTDYFIGSSAQEIILHAEMPVLSIIPSHGKGIGRTVSPKKKKSHPTRMFQNIQSMFNQSLKSHHTNEKF